MNDVYNPQDGVGVLVAGNMTPKVNFDQEIMNCGPAKVLVVGPDKEDSPYKDIRGQLASGIILDEFIGDIDDITSGAPVIQDEPERKQVLVNDFVFGSNTRGADESFEDYQWRRKNEKLQLKVLNKYGRSHWPGARGTLRNPK